MAGLVTSHETMGRRDLRTSVKELLDNHVVILLNFRLTVTTRCVRFLCQDLLDALTHPRRVSTFKGVEGYSPNPLDPKP